MIGDVYLHLGYANAFMVAEVLSFLERLIAFAHEQLALVNGFVAP
jgi:hypothetical protein